MAQVKYDCKMVVKLNKGDKERMALVAERMRLTQSSLIRLAVQEFAESQFKKWDAES